MATEHESKGPLIPPIYKQAGPNQPIDLGSTHVEFTYKQKVYQRTAKITMQFLPTAQLLFTIPAEDLAEHPLWTLTVGMSLVQAGPMQLTLTDRGISIEAFCLRADADGLTLTPTQSPITVTRRTKKLSMVIFHLFNFPNFYGSQDYAIISGEPPVRQGIQRCGRIVLKADGWKVTIAATNESCGLTESLQRQGGYIITHMGRLEREDGSTFPVKQAESLLYCVHQFLSFALGRWAGVALPVGLDAGGRHAFEQWDLPLAAAGSWNGSASWFALHHAELLSDVFPGFFALLNDKSWKDHLRVALYWYLAANERATSIGVDAGIILAQTALERLAWVHCVEHQKIVSEEAFKPRGLSAADKLRMLVSTLGIPVQIPRTMRAMNGKRGRKWADIPDAITLIRNSLVHPYEKELPPADSYYEAWQLSMWLLDLALLRLCNHGGDYANRTAGPRYLGQVERVPWSK